MLIFLLLSAVSSNKFLVDSSDSIKFVRDIRGLGLKQELHTSIELNKVMDCVLYDSISQEWFIDIEEVPRDLKIEFESNIDIELPSALSKPHNFSIKFNSTTQFVIPIHIRYNDCSYTEKYKEVFLPNPTIRCGGYSFRVKGDMISALVPVGDSNDKELVIVLTMCMVLISVSWIVLSIPKSSIKKVD